MSATARRGVDALLEVLRSEGVTHIFGNPGSTELPLMEAISDAPDLRYILALQEASAVAMAEGYARTTKTPAFLNLHTAAGLGNAMGNLTNARKNGAPLVVTAGQQDRRHRVWDPMLSGDLVGLAASVCKWTHEVTESHDVAAVTRRAFHDAASFPQGPVFISFPLDVLDDTVEDGSCAPSTRDLASVAGSLNNLADLLTELAPHRLAIVAGDEIASTSAVDSLVRVAEALGVCVFGSPLHANTVFPTTHPLWEGSLAPAAAAIRKRLDPFERVLLIGGQAFMTFPYTPGPVLPDHTELLHLSPDPDQLGRSHPTRLGLQGNPQTSLDSLLPLLEERIDATAAQAELETAKQRQAQTRAQQQAQIARLAGAEPIHPMYAVRALLQDADDAIVVDEAVTNSRYVRSLHRTSRGDRYYYCRAGGLGWAMPAACGVCLGHGRNPVLCIVGDGAAMYSPQALWTAAHERLPIVFAVLNNQQYLILKDVQTQRGKTDAFTGMDITSPAVDFALVAQSMGVTATSVSHSDQIADALADGLTHEGPFLIDIPVAAGVDDQPT
jgi:benzoylformate decarboxylase